MGSRVSQDSGPISHMLLKDAFAGTQKCITVTGPMSWTRRTPHRLPQPPGVMLAWQRLIKARGFDNVSIPYFVWNDLRMDKKLYLQKVSMFTGLLIISAVGCAGPHQLCL